MKKLLVIHDDEYLCDFLERFLSRHDYEIIKAKKTDAAIKTGSKNKPDLIIVNKDQSNINLNTFIQKKRKNKELHDTPVFYLGSLSTDDMNTLKNQNVDGLIETPINPETLLERLNLFFHIENNDTNINTPMLLDIHVKGHIIIIQIEANLEPDKLEVLNYEIRTLCKQKRFNSPKILFIIPSLYPETLTEENINLLFHFLNYAELKISPDKIKFLTQCEQLLSKLEKHETYKNFEIVYNLIDGIQKLNLDMANKKTVKVSALENNASFLFDLYDKKNNIIVPALTKITEEIHHYLQDNKLKELVYYSEENIEKMLIEKKKTNIMNTETEKIITDYEIVDENIDMIKGLNDKIKLFFRKLKKYSVLVVSLNQDNNQIIFKALNPYVNINFLHDTTTIPKIDGDKYISIFLDMETIEQSIIDLLEKIKTNTTFNNTKIIITATKISAEMLSKLKKSGTDNILFSPFSTSKVLYKVFESINSGIK